MNIIFQSKLYWVNNREHRGNLMWLETALVKHELARYEEVLRVLAFLLIDVHLNKFGRAEAVIW